MLGVFRLLHRTLKNKKAKRVRAAAVKNKKAVDAAFKKGPRRKIKYVDYKVSKKQFPVDIIAVSFIIATLAFYVVLNQAQIADCDSQISSMKNQIAEYEIRSNNLRLQLQDVTDYKEIEQYCIRTGMVKASRNKKVFISLQCPDKITKLDPPDEAVYSIGTFLSGAYQLLWEFLD